MCSKRSDSTRSRNSSKPSNRSSTRAPFTLRAGMKKAKTNTGNAEPTGAMTNVVTGS